MRLLSVVIWLLGVLCPPRFRMRFFLHARCLVQWFRVGRYEW